MRTVEQIVEQIRSFAGADFAFVLTRKGRLVTYRAPRDMPEEGRNRLVRTARPLIGTERIAELTLPREELVPYGGAAPVDVYLSVAAEQAIICVVMATWADKIRVASAMSAGMKAIEPLLKRGLPTVRKQGDLAPTKGSPYVGDKRTMPPPAFVPSPLEVAPAPLVPRVSSVPDIHVAEAELGHLSMVAIRHDVSATASSPDITYGDAELGRQSMVAVRRELIGSSSVPEIVVTGEATLGRESLAAIDLDGKPRPTSSPDAIRIELVSVPEADLRESSPSLPVQSRATVPWVELPGDSKRAADAALLGRKLAPPKVTLKLEEADDSVLAATQEEMAPSPRAPQDTIAYEQTPPGTAKVAKR